MSEVDARYAGALAASEHGQVGYSGYLLALSRRLDALFTSWAEQWEAVEWAFPPFISLAELGRIDYLTAFPHLAMFPVALAKDEAQLAAFAQSHHGGPGRAVLPETQPVQQILTPAACYHVYIRYQGQEYDAPQFITTRNTCFRSEVEFTPLERQSGFSMREIVCIGSEEEVQGFLETQQARLAALARGLELRTDFQGATDPFFQPARNPKALVQRLAPSKTELVFDGRLAVGSLNFHRNYFGEAYGLTRGGKPLFSGCVAFGIERWMAMVLAQFGHDSRDWPALLRTEASSPARVLK